MQGMAGSSRSHEPSSKFIPSHSGLLVHGLCGRKLGCWATTHSWMSLLVSFPWGGEGLAAFAVVQGWPLPVCSSLGHKDISPVQQIKAIDGWQPAVVLILLLRMETRRVFLLSHTKYPPVAGRRPPASHLAESSPFPLPNLSRGLTQQNAHQKTRNPKPFLFTDVREAGLYPRGERWAPIQDRPQGWSSLAAAGRLGGSAKLPTVPKEKALRGKTLW